MHLLPRRRYNYSASEASACEPCDTEQFTPQKANSCSQTTSQSATLRQSPLPFSHAQSLAPWGLCPSPLFISHHQFLFQDCSPRSHQQRVLPCAHPYLTRSLCPLPYYCSKQKFPLPLSSRSQAFQPPGASLRLSPSLLYLLPLPHLWILPANLQACCLELKLH